MRRRIPIRGGALFRTVLFPFILFGALSPCAGGISGGPSGDGGGGGNGGGDPIDLMPPGGARGPFMPVAVVVAREDTQHGGGGGDIQPDHHHHHHQQQQQQQQHVTYHHNGPVNKARGSHDDPLPHECEVGDDVSVRNGVHRDLAAGRYAEVEACLVRYVARFPRSAVAWYNLGYARAQLGGNDRALEAIEAAVAIEPGNGVFLEQMTVLLFATGDPHRALSAARRAAQASPSSATAHALVARAVRAVSGAGLVTDVAEGEAAALRSAYLSTGATCSDSGSGSGSGSGSDDTSVAVSAWHAVAELRLINGRPDEAAEAVRRALELLGEGERSNSGGGEQGGLETGTRTEAEAESGSASGSSAGAAAGSSVTRSDLLLTLAAAHASARPPRHAEAHLLLRRVSSWRPACARTASLAGATLRGVADGRLSPGTRAHERAMCTVTRWHEHSLHLDHRGLLPLSGVLGARRLLCDWGSDWHRLVFGFMAVLRYGVDTAGPSLPVDTASVAGLPFPPSVKRSIAVRNAWAAAVSAASRGEPWSPRVDTAARSPFALHRVSPRDDPRGVHALASVAAQRRLLRTVVAPSGGTTIRLTPSPASGRTEGSPEGYHHDPSAEKSPHAPRLAPAHSRLAGALVVGVLTGCGDVGGPAVYTRIARPGVRVIVYDTCTTGARRSSAWTDDLDGSLTGGDAADGVIGGRAGVSVRAVPASSSSPEQVALMIRGDGVDVLFAASPSPSSTWRRGASAGPSEEQDWLETLALRPAPVQLVLGAPQTTGAAYVDYLVLDAWTVAPQEASALLVEKVAFLPHAHVFDATVTTTATSSAALSRKAKKSHKRNGGSTNQPSPPPTSTLRLERSGESNGNGGGPRGFLVGRGSDLLFAAGSGSSGTVLLTGPAPGSPSPSSSSSSSTPYTGTLAPAVVIEPISTHRSSSWPVASTYFVVDAPLELMDPLTADALAAIMRHAGGDAVLVLRGRGKPTRASDHHRIGASNDAHAVPHVDGGDDGDRDDDGVDADPTDPLTRRALGSSGGGAAVVTDCDGAASSAVAGTAGANLLRELALRGVDTDAVHFDSDPFLGAASMLAHAHGGSGSGNSNGNGNGNNNDNGNSNNGRTQHRINDNGNDGNDNNDDDKGDTGLVAVVALDPLRDSHPDSAQASLATGIPLVTLRGDTLASRRAAAVLAGAGCAGGLVAGTVAEYVRLALVHAGIIDDGDVEDMDANHDIGSGSVREAALRCLAAAGKVRPETHAASLARAAEAAFDRFITKAPPGHMFVK